MPVRNAETADLFDRMAGLLEIQGANPFRVRAYRNAARTVSGLPRSVADMLAAEEDLSKLPGIGRDLAEKIAEIVDTRYLAALEEVEEEVPAGLVDLTRLLGLGPKRVKILHEDLGIRDLAELERAAREHRIRELAGFGAHAVGRGSRPQGMARARGRAQHPISARAQEAIDANLNARRRICASALGGRASV